MKRNVFAKNYIRMLALFFIFIGSFISTIVLLPTGVGFADVRKAIIYPGQSNPNKILWFIHISDPHIGKFFHSEEAKNNLEWIVKTAWPTINPSFIVCTGDLTDGSDPGHDEPTGPQSDEWNDYYNIVNHDGFKEIYYDLPGNHDRYEDIDWDGETGADGYRNKSIMGPISSPIGQFHWERENNLFYALNTCDETAAGFFINTHFRGSSDFPQLSDKELSAANSTIESFRGQDNSKLLFLFGHHSIYTETSFIAAVPSILALPGLYHSAGYVFNYLLQDTDIGDDKIYLLDTELFPSEGEGKIGNHFLTNWDDFIWNSKNGEEDVLSQIPTDLATKKYSLTVGHDQSDVVAGRVDDRGAGQLIGMMNSKQVSAYLYGHTHQNRVWFDEDHEIRSLLINTADLLKGNYRIVAIDNGGLSTVTAKKDEWPVVLITSPVDKELGGTNPYVFPIPKSEKRSDSNKIRALVFFPENSTDQNVSFHTTGGISGDPCLLAGDMNLVSGMAHVYEGNLELLHTCTLTGSPLNSDLWITVTASYKEQGSGEPISKEHTIKAQVAQESDVFTMLYTDIVEPGNTYYLQISKEGEGDIVRVTLDGKTLLAKGEITSGSYDVMVYIPEEAEAGDHFIRVFDEKSHFKDFPVHIKSDTLVVRTMPSGDKDQTAYTWVGNPLTIWGNAKTDSGLTYQYQWDVDNDGTADYSGTVSNPKDIACTHTYAAAGLYEAKLTVTDSDGNSGESIVRINVLPSVTKVARINLAIERGLKWLYLQQRSDGAIYSYNYYGSAGAETAAAVLAFENRGHKPCTQDLDDDGDVDTDDRTIWERDKIYAETVHKGLDYAISTLRSFPIPSQGAGNPDTNGNGLGIADSYTSRQPYKIGMYMMALVGAGDPGSGAPELIATTGPANVINRTYREIVQDMVDWCAYAQVEPNRGGARGGWRYGPNYYNSDNSACQWPAIGMEAAESGWGCTVPTFVKQENALWTTVSQYFTGYEASSAYGGFGYTGKGTGAARTAAGICQLSFQGKTKTDPRILAAARRIGQYDRGIGRGYDMYAIAKACRIAKIDTDSDGIGDTHSEIELLDGWDWYEAFADNLINTQRSNGSWYNSYHYVFSTAWAVEILTKNVFTLRPIARIEAIPPSSPANSQVDFDISKSFHQDSGKTLVDWWIDVDNDGTFDLFGSFPVSGIVGFTEYADQGHDYTVSARLRVSDNSDPVAYADDIVSIRITSANVAPVADPGGPYEGVIGAPITFDGSGSYDPNEGAPLNDAIASYEWDLDGDGQYDDASGEIVQHTWSAAYQGYVGLKVTDSFALTNTSQVYTKVFVVDLFPENYAMVSRKRINRYVYEYEYRFDMRNRGTGTASNVVCTIDSVPAQVTLVDNRVSFGTIEGGTVVTSGDTFKYRIDRRYPVADFQIKWKLEYDDAGGDHVSFVDFPLR